MDKKLKSHWQDFEIQIFKIRDSETIIFPEIRDSETLFLSAEIPRLGVNLPRLNIFERPFATPNRGSCFLRLKYVKRITL